MASMSPSKPASPPPISALRRAPTMVSSAEFTCSGERGPEDRCAISSCLIVSSVMTKPCGVKRSDAGPDWRAALSDRYTLSAAHRAARK
eukprot:3936530-Rhodomonas_salina.3